MESQSILVRYMRTYVVKNCEPQKGTILNSRRFHLLFCCFFRKKNAEGGEAPSRVQIPDDDVQKLIELGF
jgi:hypothetical protein